MSMRTLTATPVAARSDLEADIIRQLRHQAGVAPADATPREWLRATSFAVRNVVVERWHDTNARVRSDGSKQVCYLSMEFLMARQLENALIATGLRQECEDALARQGVTLSDMLELEPDPALGNGGLGRLAACFLDSMAATGVHGIGYGIRYEYGMFRQEFADGWQIEQPDDWLIDINPWEFQRPAPSYPIGSGGHVEHRDGRAHWHPAECTMAVAHDMLVPGHDGAIVNTLRLWGAKPLNAFDFATFNRGNFLEALAPKIRSKTVTRLLYPDDSTAEGRELRLRQEHFFASASMQDMIARFRKDHGDWALLPDKVAVHLNDTHPALAPAELMRLLVDVHEVTWDIAWDLTSNVFSYTNHTLMPEALEVWQVELMRRIVPRHLDIINEINRRFLEQVAAAGKSEIFADRVSVITGVNTPRVNMARFSALVSRRVNGVSELHSRLVRETLFPEFAELFPDRFDNVTNGISQRLWLEQANPGLTALLDERLDAGWRKSFDLSKLALFADDVETHSRYRDVKLSNKRRLASVIKIRTGLDVNPDAMFDVQIKRIHEYKRQLLNIIGVVARWNAMKADPGAQWPSRVVILGGKAAAGYWLAKLIIKLAHDVARRVNNDPDTNSRLKLVFLPNYNVSLAERIIPAADLSQQISLAGTEASGTGNMKLALNGALTLGTADGANIEIADAVGAENVFTFGLKVDEVSELKRKGYVPLDVCNADNRLRTVVEQIARGDFSPEDPHRFEPVIASLLSNGDRYMVLEDFAAYWDAQRRVDADWQDQRLWTRKTILNTAGMGSFTADRSIEHYAKRIWRSSPQPV